MTKDEMKNRISFALKDPILQQGFELICRENATLKEDYECLEDAHNVLNELYEKLEKENAELRNNGFTVSAMTEQQLKEALKKGEQLEKENTDLRDNYDQFRASAIPEIERLQKENKELKADNDARKFAMAMSEQVEKQLREENVKAKYLLLRFYSDTNCEFPINIKDVIAWKEIVLPEPKESEQK